MDTSCDQSTVRWWIDPKTGNISPRFEDSRKTYCSDIHNVDRVGLGDDCADFLDETLDQVASIDFASKLVVFLLVGISIVSSMTPQTSSL